MFRSSHLLRKVARYPICLYGQSCLEIAHRRRGRFASFACCGKRRRATQAVAASTFFQDRGGRPWKSAAAFRQQFNRLREELEKEHPSFPTRYYVGTVPGDPLRIQTSDLTMRTMRHTCVTLNYDAGISRELIRSITGHSPQSIDEIMAHYTARTADQAEAALSLRLTHETNPGRKTNLPKNRRQPAAA